jgi:hypothetical protein
VQLVQYKQSSHVFPSSCANLTKQPGLSTWLMRFCRASADAIRLENVGQQHRGQGTVPGFSIGARSLGQGFVLGPGDCARVLKVMEDSLCPARYKWDKGVTTLMKYD